MLTGRIVGFYYWQNRNILCVAQTDFSYVNCDGALHGTALGATMGDEGSRVLENHDGPMTEEQEERAGSAASQFLDDTTESH